MSNFTCPSCGSETLRLVATGVGLKCPNCDTTPNRTTIINHSRVTLPSGKKISEGTYKHIWNRAMPSDGGKVVDKVTGKKWSL
jgi:ribosomal protein L37AE/L43A